MKRVDITDGGTMETQDLDRLISTIRGLSDENQFRVEQFIEGLTAPPPKGISPSVWKAITALRKANGNVVSHEALSFILALNTFEPATDDHVKVIICKARKKLDPGEMIVNVHATGYRLVKVL